MGLDGLNWKEPEPFVDGERAAAFLSMPRKTIMSLARKGALPGHPIGIGLRRVWRFRLSELDRWLQAAVSLDSDQGRFTERKHSL